MKNVIKILTTVVFVIGYVVPSAKSVISFSELYRNASGRYECVAPYDFLQQQVQRSRSKSAFIRLLQTLTEITQLKVDLDSWEAMWARGFSSDPFPFPLIPQEEIEEIFQMFIERSHEVPSNALMSVRLLPANKLVFFGDVHGGIHTLLRGLKDYIADDNFKLKEEFCLFCTGDFTDRWSYGTEVLYVWLRLKLANWDQVYFVRGNHEDLQINYSYGLAKEWETKYSKTHESSRFPEDLFQRVYDKIPLGIVINYGGKRLFVSHAGLPSSIPSELLFPSETPLYLSLTESTEIKKLSWSDLVRNYEERLPEAAASRPLLLVQDAQKFLTDRFTAWFRGHQHYDDVVKMVRQGDPQPGDTNEPMPWKKIVSPEDQKAEGFLIEQYIPIFTLSSGAGNMLIPNDGHAIVYYDAMGALRLLSKEMLGRWGQRLSCWIPIMPEFDPIAPAHPKDFYVEVLCSYPRDHRADILKSWLRKSIPQEKIALLWGLVFDSRLALSATEKDALDQATQTAMGASYEGFVARLEKVRSRAEIEEEGATEEGQPPSRQSAREVREVEEVPAS